MKKHSPQEWKIFKLKIITLTVILVVIVFCGVWWL